MILNAALLAIPIVLGLVGYGIATFPNDIQVDPATGDPITYKHIVWIEFSVWPFAIYLLVPNVIFAMFFVISRNRN
jgi:hypothetical protein